jgi:protein MBA1
LIKYYGKPEVVSYKFMLVPEGAKNDKLGMAQAVVKIKSKQSLQHLKRMRMKEVTNDGGSVMRVKNVLVDEQGEPLPESVGVANREKNAKVLTEYLVVQRMMKNSKFGPWHIWGTTEETSIATMKKQKRAYKAKIDAQQKMKDGK